MTAIKIKVNKQLDGYNFSIGPSIREVIKKIFPNAHPANNIFVAYDIKSNFESYRGNLEKYIFPALTGIDEDKDLKKMPEVQFVDSQTGEILHVMPNTDNLQELIDRLVHKEADVVRHEKMSLLKKAASDPLFLADIDEIHQDFDHSDRETI